MEKMEGYKICNVNPSHYYEDNLAECPYCLGEASNEDNDETVFGNDPGDEYDDEFDKDATEKEGQKKKKRQNKEKEEVIEEDGTFVQRKNDLKGKSKTTSKKIVGWLITYDFNPNGLDYKLYEGKNEFGSSTKTKNSIPGDKEISGFHFTIIYRNGKFAIKDEQSTNGTTVNKEPLDLINSVVELKDKDVLHVGETTLYFRSSIQEINTADK